MIASVVRTGDSVLLRVGDETISLNPFQCRDLLKAIGTVYSDIEFREESKSQIGVLDVLGATPEEVSESSGAIIPESLS